MSFRLLLLGVLVVMAGVGAAPREKRQILGAILDGLLGISQDRTELLLFLVSSSIISDFDR